MFNNKSFQLKHAVLALVFVVVGCGGGSGTVDAEDDSPLQEVETLEPDVGPSGSTTAADTPQVPEAEGQAASAQSSLYVAFQTLRKGMTKAEVLAHVGVTPSDDKFLGSNLFWLDEAGGLVVYFDLNIDPQGIVAYAEWAFRASSNLPRESRNLR